MVPSAKHMGFVARGEGLNISGRVLVQFQAITTSYQCLDITWSKISHDTMFLRSRDDHVTFVYTVYSMQLHTINMLDDYKG